MSTTMPPGDRRPPAPDGAAAAVAGRNEPPRAATPPTAAAPISPAQLRRRARGEPARPGPDGPAGPGRDDPVGLARRAASSPAGEHRPDVGRSNPPTGGPDGAAQLGRPGQGRAGAAGAGGSAGLGQPAGQGLDRTGQGLQGLGNALTMTGVGAKAGIALQAAGAAATAAADGAKARQRREDTRGESPAGNGRKFAGQPSSGQKKRAGETGSPSGGKTGLKDKALGAPGKALDRVDLNDKAIKAGNDNLLGEDSVAGRMAQQAYRTGLKVLGRINPKLALAVKVVPALILVVLILVVTAIIAVIVGVSAPGAPEAVEDTEALEDTEISDDHLRAYKGAALEHGVPWPILAAIGEVASKHGTVNPYTVQEMNGALPVPGPGRIEPGNDGVGGTGPLLLSDEALEHPLRVGSPHDYYDAIDSVAAILRDWVDRYVEGEIPDIDETVRVGAGGAATSIAVAFGGAPGSMIIPTEGRISSEFGYRIHPLSGARRLHAGMDIAAPGGTPIHAGAAGVVDFVGWRGGYGNTVIVDHGGGITTLYAHQSRTGTSVGSQVAQGEVIGFVGTTGYSTGNHLHWEVRVNGDPQNPRNFL
ncbi:MAG TPA: M23 family metallopeptidase, partial [Euzebya sp.]|nr:M23 family metallopeptidase [Euzebya sp.]